MCRCRGESWGGEEGLLSYSGLERLRQEDPEFIVNKAMREGRERTERRKRRGRPGKGQAALNVNSTYKERSWGDGL